MIKRSRYCFHVMSGFVMAVLLAACGGTDTTKAVSTTVPAVFYAHTVATKNDGSVYAWGVNSYGQLGTGNLSSSSLPLKVQGLPAGMTGASAGGTHTLVFNLSGAYAWGNNGFGQLGDGTQNASMTPVSVVKYNTTTKLTGITAVSAGGSHSLALVGDSVWAWGDNLSGQLGDATFASRTGAVNVLDATGLPIAGVTMIAAGGDHSLALKSDRTVWAWGSNPKGQLGNNTVINSTIPVKVLKEGNVPLENIIAIAAGGSHSLALDATGTVWAWGLNSVGQLGNGDAGDSTVPSHVADTQYAVKVLLPAIASISVSGTQLAAGLDHSLVIDNAGHVWGWGLNFSGQLGNGAKRNIVGISTPVQTAPLPSAVTAVVAVGNHSLGFAGTEAWAWGENTFGQLGNGTNSEGRTTDSALPLAVQFP